MLKPSIVLCDLHSSHHPTPPTCLPSPDVPGDLAVSVGAGVAGVAHPHVQVHDGVEGGVLTNQRGGLWSREWVACCGWSPGPGWRRSRRRTGHITQSDEVGLNFGRKLLH